MISILARLKLQQTTAHLRLHQQLLQRRPVPWKRFTIFHPIAYLTCPSKPKIQKVDRETIADFCDIAMEFLVNSDNYKNEEAVEDYKRYAEDRRQLASFDMFPGVRDFINETMNAECKALISTCSTTLPDSQRQFRGPRTGERVETIHPRVFGDYMRPTRILAKDDE